MSKILSLSSFRKATTHSVSDLLPYAFSPEVGYVVNKDGSFMATWEYEGGNERSKTGHERDVQMTYINNALARFGSGWAFHINCARRLVEAFPAEDRSSFPESISELLETERREFFSLEGNSYKTRFYITLTYLPTTEKSKKYEKYFFDVHGGEDEGEQEHAGELLFNDFKQKISEFEDALSVGLRVRRLAGKTVVNGDITYETDEHLNFLNECVTGKPQLMRIPSPACYLDAVLGKATLASGVTPKINDEFISLIDISGFPNYTHAGYLNQLSELGFEFRWNSRFIPLNAYEAERVIRKYATSWNQKAIGLMNYMQKKEPDRRDELAEGMNNDARAAATLCGSGEVKFGDYTGCVVLRGKTIEDAEEKAAVFIKAFLSLGVTDARRETINSVECFLGSLSGNTYANIRRPILHTRNVADIMPSSSAFSGLPYAPSDKFPRNAAPLAVLQAGNSNTPFWLNLHVSDVGHTLVFGPTGSGKSVLLSFLASQMLRYKDCQIFAFDKGMSMYAINQAVEGSHYEVGGEESTSLNFSPLSNLQSVDDLEWAADWVQTLMRLQGEDPTIEDKVSIREALSQSIGKTGIDGTLGSFGITVQNEKVKGVIDIYSSLPLYNAEDDGLKEGFFQCFEIEELMNLPEEKSLPIMLYLFRIIEKRLKGQPSFIIIDEAWQVLGHEVFRAKIREWLKVLRKANCAVILATQSISDASRSGIIDVLQESCPTKIFLPNPSAGLEEFAQHYAKLGLNSAQRKIIQESIPKQDYFVNSPLGDRRVNLALGPIALSLYTKSSKKDIASIKEFQETHGKIWPIEWIEHCINPENDE